MSKILKVMLSIIALLIILILVTVITCVSVINPNHFKSEVSQLVHQKTGRELVLNGDISWSFFPWLGLQIKQAQLSNAPGFGSEPFAQIQRIKVRVKLLPLLHRQIEVDEITVDGLDLRLVKNSEGKTNWQDLTKHTGNSAHKRNKHFENTNSPLAMMALAIASVNITNGHISWSDQQKNQSYNINQLQVRSSNIKLSQPFQTDIRFVLHGQQPNLKGDFHIHQTIDIHSDNQFSTNGVLSINSLEANGLKLSDITATIQANNNFIRFNPITANLYQGKFNGDVDVKRITQIPNITTNAQLSNIQIEPLLKDIKPSDSVKGSGSANVSLHLTTAGNNADAILQHLNGKALFSVEKGVLEGIDISYWINSAKNLLNTQAGSAPTNTQQTELGNLSGTFVIVNGIAHNDDLILKSPKLNATGKGVINLVDQNLNYQINAQAMDANGKPEGITIPLLVSGTFDHVKIRPAMDSLITTEIKNHLEGQKENIKKQITSIFDNSQSEDTTKNTSNSNNNNSNDATDNNKDNLKENIGNQIKNQLNNFLSN